MEDIVIDILISLFEIVFVRLFFGKCSVFVILIFVVDRLIFVSLVVGDLFYKLVIIVIGIFVILRSTVELYFFFLRNITFFVIGIFFSVGIVLVFLLSPEDSFKRFPFSS